MGSKANARDGSSYSVRFVVILVGVHYVLYYSSNVSAQVTSAIVKVNARGSYQSTNLCTVAGDCN